MPTEELLKSLEGTETKVRIHFDAPHGEYEPPFIGRVKEVNVGQGYFVFTYVGNKDREYKVYAEFVDRAEVVS